MAEKTIIIDATDSAGSQVENLSQLLTSGWQIRTAYSVGREGTALMVILKKTTQETDQKAARLIKNVAGDELSGVASLNSYLHGEGVAGQQKIIRRFPVGDQALLIIIGAPPAGDPTPVAQEAFLVGTLGDPAAAVATINARMSEPDNPWQHKRSNPWQILTAYVVGKKGTSLLVIMEKRSGPHVQVKLVKNTGSDQDSGRAALAAYQADERAGGFVIARRYSIGDQAALYLLGDPPADGDASEEECCGEIFTGSGAPSDSIGADGNTYFDTTTGDMYRKRDGRWGSAVATLKGSAGNKILSGSGDPSGVSGLTASAGDLYIDTANSRLYQRGASSWGQIAVLSGSPGAQGVTGPQGLAGPQGAKGDTGVQGTQGAQGSTGAQGVAGNTGVQGTQGTTGVQGAQGIKGDTGIQGVQGAQGNTGIQGTQGHTGIQGLQGVQGTTGIQGVQGTQGNTGIQGIQGTQGHTGIQGIQGTQGLTGTQGIQGTQGNTGIQGIKGDTGIQGLQGVKGDTGIQGIQGTQGLTGIAGKEVLSDTGAPAGALGKIGDLYIDTQTYQLLRKTAGTTWTAAGYVKGSTGLQGVQGNTGIQGIQGTQGNTGIQGVQGTQGNTGIQGIQGLQGNTGIQGIQGTQGLTGIQGVAGLDGKEVLSDTGAPAGALGKIGDLYIDTQSYQLLRKTAGATWTPAGYVKGSTGIQGVQGNTGIQGIQGTQGNTGIQGVQGTQGNTGIQGVAGIDGKEVLSDTGAPGGALGKIGDLYIDTQTYQLLRKTSGTTWTPAGYVKGSTGIQGVQGNTGIQGIQGTQGNTGIQGIQGAQGNTGIQGVAGIDGKEVLSDTGAPAGTLGKIGDLYIDTQTYQLLRKTAGTAWTAAGYVKGSTGIQGVQGNTGIQGIQGTQGNTGIQGVQGIKGDTGIQGVQGTQGSTGIQGIQGTQGNTGIQGVAGIDGKEVLSDTGAPAGALGKIGDLYIDTLTYQMSRKTGAATWTPGGYVKGSTGIQGIQGTQGNTGIQGIQGTQGNTGIQGVQGVQGNTGIQGIQGTQGNTGIQGTQGLTGIPGKEVLSDTGAPAGALGKIGDLYIDTLTYQLSRKTGATTWTAAGYVKGSTGIQGVQGNTGIQGIQGTQGNTGIQGIQGTQGNTGIQGIQGTQGNTGIQGIQGIKGDTGIQGVQGTQGNTGIQGVAGIDGKEVLSDTGAPAGALGKIGDLYIDTLTYQMSRKTGAATWTPGGYVKGSTGIQGIQGTQGNTGIQGIQGTQGNTGIQGVQGIKGDTGIQGVQGTQGNTGIQGVQGVQGNTGIQGVQGTQGNTGIQGVAGIDGKEVLSDTGAPAGALGKIGDLYIDTLTYQMSRKTGAATWTPGGYVKGSTGIQGIQGTQGNTGIQGIQGTQGNTGIQGIQGTQGNTGIQGVQGIKGDTGIQGLQGVQGNTGIQGIQGTQGNTGIQGTQGSTGIPGKEVLSDTGAPAGALGKIGDLYIDTLTYQLSRKTGATTWTAAGYVKGDTGIQGVQGIQGTQGNTGIQGVQGIKGDTGIQGLQGVQGNTGIQGIQGTQGNTGIQGTQGSTGIPGKEVLSDTGAPAGALGKIGDLYIDTLTYQLSRKTATTTWTAAGYVKGSTGIQGVQGNTGIQGIQGTQGNTGIQGIQGTQGNTGIQGIQGTQGNTGIQGVQGIKGDTGIQGVQGTQGNTGIQGVAGIDGKEVLSDTGAPAGALGKIGDLYIDTLTYQMSRKTGAATWTPGGYVKGSTGIQGIQGTQGNTGIQGIQGTQGNTGIQGIQGTQGNTGIQGVQGIKGDTGIQGLQGVQGNTGIQGIQGTQGNTGIQGTQGSTGIPGKEVLSDTGAPAGALGKIGDLYIDTLTYQLSRKTGATTWTAAGYVKGSTGIQGVQGNTGIQGVQGTQGNTGIQGIQGVQGNTGIQGIQGTQGNTGIQGVQGIKGDTGIQGTQGNTGIQGVAGIDGKEVLSDTGAPAGALGKIGDLYIDTLTYQMSRKTGAATWTPGGYVKGSTGIQGIQGTQGNTGIQGIQGTQGNTGIQGVAGIDGKEVLSDTGAPAGALGKIGDLYIDTLTYQMSRKTGAATWTPGGYVKGSTGIQGIQGTQGNTGIQGIQGTQGNTGIQGIQGVQGNTGIQGVQGTQGNTGIQGVQGTQGNTGIQGVQGIKGDTGIQGLQGVQGNTGIQGIQGTQGNTGIQGTQGSTGIPGKEVLSDTGAPAGALGKIGDLYIDTLTYQLLRKTGSTTWTAAGYVKGSTGLQGVQGNTGIQGIQGTQGNTGIQGIQGTQGNTGIQGVQGIKGDTGIQGVQGTQGNTGIQGIQGVQGNTGIQGIQGTQGNTGIQGVAGIDGKEVLSDTGAPAGALGKIGDLYIDTLTYQMSRKTGAVTWTPGGYVKGSTGIQGIQGTQGNTGIQGIQGTQGNTGIQGIQGVQGNTGIQGVQGIKGDTGIQGVQGTQGNTGIQGIQGTQGNTGIQGVQGIKGDTGIQGIQGTQGNTGIQGIQGTQGNTGIQGIQGTQGNTGIQGVAGIDGKEVLSDTGTPRPDIGKIGDLYIDTLTYLMSRKVGPVTWTPTGNIKGPAGAQGATGIQGNQGNAGSQGATGLQGGQGIQGNTGVQGIQGATGVQGVQGIPGTQGVTGPAGGGGSGSSPQFILYQERQSSGSNAGIWGADTGTWITRFLNYRAADDTSSVTFVNTPDRNGRGLSIPAGTYIIKRAFAAAFGVGSHIARIRVVSTGETFYGTEGIDNGGQGNSYSEIVGAKFTINSTSTIFLEQICASPTGTNNARGTAVGVPDDTIVNIFSSIELQKVA